MERIPDWLLKVILGCVVTVTCVAVILLIGLTPTSNCH
jgi:hypothetical protein